MYKTKRKDRKGKERKGKERKGKERKGKERKESVRAYICTAGKAWRQANRLRLQGIEDKNDYQTLIRLLAVATGKQNYPIIQNKQMRSKQSNCLCDTKYII
jgi:hypothetical protein